MSLVEEMTGANEERGRSRHEERLSRLVWFLSTELGDARSLYSRKKAEAVREWAKANAEGIDYRVVVDRMSGALM